MCDIIVKAIRAPKNQLGNDVMMILGDIINLWLLLLKKTYACPNKGRLARIAQIRLRFFKFI